MHTPLRAVLVLAMILFAGAAEAQLTVVPTRLILGDEPSGQFILLNPTDGPITYELGWVYLKPDAQGQLVEAPADDGYAGEFLRFAPRRSTVPPRGQQLVRIAARPPTTDGGPREWRAHLRITPVVRPDDPEAAVATEEPAVAEAEAPAFRFDVVTALDVPVVVRQGAGTVAATLTDPERVPEGIAVTVTRTGDFSVIGTIGLNGPATDASPGRDTVVYADMQNRRIVVPVPEGVAVSRLVLTEIDSDRVIAETTVP